MKALKRGKIIAKQHSISSIQITVRRPPRPPGAGLEAVGDHPEALPEPHEGEEHPEDAEQREHQRGRGQRQPPPLLWEKNRMVGHNSNLGPIPAVHAYLNKKSIKNMHDIIQKNMDAYLL